MLAFIVSWCRCVFLCLRQLLQLRIQVFKCPLEQRPITIIPARLQRGKRSGPGQEYARSFGFSFQILRAWLAFLRVLSGCLSLVDLIFYRLTFPSSCHDIYYNPADGLMDSPADHRLCQRGGHDAITAAGFGRIQRMVGLFDELFRQIFRPECRHTTTEGQPYPGPAIDGDFDLSELSANPVENNAGLCGISVRQNDGEFVAADTAQNIFLAQIDANKLRKKLQNLVATTVPDFIVNFLE